MRYEMIINNNNNHLLIRREKDGWIIKYKDIHIILLFVEQSSNKGDIPPRDYIVALYYNVHWFWDGRRESSEEFYNFIII